MFYMYRQLMSTTGIYVYIHTRQDQGYMYIDTHNRRLQLPLHHFLTFTSNLTQWSTSNELRIGVNNWWLLRKIIVFSWVHLPSNSERLLNYWCITSLSTTAIMTYILLHLVSTRAAVNLTNDAKWLQPHWWQQTIGRRTMLIVNWKMNAKFLSIQL